MTAFEGTPASSTPSGWRCRSPCSPSATLPPSPALPACSAGNTASRLKQRRPDPAQHHRHAGGLRALLRLLLRAGASPRPSWPRPRPRTSPCSPYLANITDNPVIVTLGAAHRLHRHQLLLPPARFLGARESLKSPDRQAHQGLPLARADQLGIALMFFAIWGRRHHQPGHSGADGDPLRPPSSP